MSVACPVVEALKFPHQRVVSRATSVIFGVCLLRRGCLLKNWIACVGAKRFQRVCRRLYLHLRRRQPHKLFPRRNFPSLRIPHRVKFVSSQINNASEPFRDSRVATPKVRSIPSAPNRHMLKARHVHFKHTDALFLDVVLFLLRNCDNVPVYGDLFGVGAMNFLDYIFLRGFPAVNRATETIKQSVVRDFAHFCLRRDAVISAGL